ncbi:hypothetical protein C5470_22665, partial [Photorhabdus stackebrandtii]|nr:hypothetical protein [Photorhabdus stackebrandtii]
VIEAACSYYHLLTQEAISREKSALTAAPATARTEKRIKQLEQQWHSVKILPAHQKSSTVFGVSSIFVDSVVLVSPVGSSLLYTC